MKKEGGAPMQVLAMSNGVLLVPCVTGSDL
jgi:hypothetical protein